MEGRSKRRTRKTIDYSREQEFSDDAFEDEATAQAIASPVVGSRSKSARASTSRRKKKKGDEDEDDDLAESSRASAAMLAAYQQQQQSTGPRFVEKGYPSDLPPIRERYLYLPEIEEDGSPRVELIVGRRPIQDEERALEDDEEEADATSNLDAENSGEENESNDEDDSDSESHSKRGSRRSSRKRSASRKTKAPPAKKKTKADATSSSKTKGSPNKLLPSATEYEYLIKYRGVSYLHLEWKSASDLESMNKSAKTLYRRFLKKIEAGVGENLEDPTVDPSFTEAEKIIDEKDEEVLMELTDQELLDWEKEREKEIAQEEIEAKAEAGEEKIKSEDTEEPPLKDHEGNEANNEAASTKEKDTQQPKTDAEARGVADGKDSTESKGDAETKDEDGEAPSKSAETANKEDNAEENEKKADDDDDLELDVENPIMDIEVLRKIIDKDGPYYPVVEGSDNPYRDGYVTEPPKKPRASYLFFQTVYRAAFNKKHPNLTQQEVMIRLGDTWRAYSEAQQAPFIQLASEEAAQFEREKQMLEKAQRPNELWQPLRRCRQVLDRLCSDSFANIFLEPVDTSIFTDYTMYVDKPMDLGTIRKNLENRKYMMPENFARDVRKVWQNCKVYNQHGSAIWFVADYMSKQFERLYHAWVLAFRNRYLRWAHPKARPWNIHCRIHEESCPEADDDSKSLMCDHCDATYGMKCLTPPLLKPPEGPWHCPDCLNAIAHNDRLRFLSAMSEQAAKRRAELGDIPRKLVKRKMFLVKWAGLGYEFCTWETKEDINDDALIAAYRKLNDMSPDEPDLTQATVEDCLYKAKHVTFENAKTAAETAGSSSHKAAPSTIPSTVIPELKSQLYAQTRAVQFSRFGSSLPPLLSNEVGPLTKSFVKYGHDDISDDYVIRQAVGATINDLVFRVSRGETQENLVFTGLGPPLYGEYDAIIPITHKGLMMNVGEINGSVAFLGYRQFPDGSKGPSEIKSLVRGVGDKIIAVDGVGTAGKSFKQVIDLLRESGKNKFCYMRFYEMRLRIGDTRLTSSGDVGEYMFAKLTDKFKLSRRKLLAERRAKLKEDDDEEDPQDKKEDEDDSDKSVGSEDISVNADDSDSDSDADDDDSNGSYSDDADDAEVIRKSREPDSSSTPTSTPGSMKSSEASPSNKKTSKSKATPDSSPSKSLSSMGVKKEKLGTVPLSGGPGTVASTTKTEEETKTHIIKRNTTTRSLALALLDLDVGYSSDEGGEEESAWFLDGVDATFASRTRAIGELHGVDDAKVLALATSTNDASEENKDENKEPKIKSNEKDAKNDGTGETVKEGEDENEDMEVDKVSVSDDDAVKNNKELEPEKAAEDKQETIRKLATADAASDILVKKNEFTPLGDTSKLLAAAMCSKQHPDPLDFDNFPNPSTRMLARLQKEEEELAAAKREAEQAKSTKDGASDSSPNKLAPSGKKSTTKIEQLSTDNEVLRVWASVAEAAATLQISLSDIQAVLSGEYNEDIGDEAGGYKWRYADENAQVTAKVTMKNRSKKGREAFLEFRDKLYDHAKPHTYKGGHKLRDYQIDGVNWLASCWYKRVGCILADEMGLGKTVQIVTYVEHLFRVEQIRGPFLIVVPLSTVEHWRREVEGWTEMRCNVYHDRQREWRDVMREYEWYYRDRPHTSDYLKFDVMITTYDTLIADFDVVGQIPWRVAVVDEAHRLRNVKGKLLECMKQISQRGTLQYGFQSRVLMTGTPLQNNTQELWTLLNFIEPFKFPSLEEFMRKFGNMANQEQVQNLQSAIAPFMLRRVKEDVAKDIPSKEETLIDVELTSIQKQYYRAIFEHNHTFLNMGAVRNNAPKLMNIQMELRKCCNHPFLLDGIEQRELEKQHTEFLESGVLNGLSPEEQHNKVHEMGYIKSSGKMVLLDKLLPKLRSEGHKVLIFSQMVRMLDLISEFCDFRGFRHERLDGSIRGNERQKAIDRYNTEEDSFVFLLSTRAGGVGINLTAADICIIFDSDWNPQNDVQAQARCHRIGQTRDVMIYRLITSKTFEQEMFDRASKKLGLEQAVLGTFGQDDDDGKPTTQEMEQLLKKGAYALMEDDDQEAKQFDEDDIESILAKRTRTRVVEGAKTSSWLNKQGLNVTKSKFTSEGADAGVDLNDPNFWQKIMPDFVTPQLLWDNLKDMIENFDQRMTGIVKPKGVGRGKGRLKKQKAEEEASKVENGDGPSPDAADDAETTKQNGDNDDANCDGEGDNGDDSSPKKKVPLITGPTKTDVKKVRKFMADLDSLMDDVFDQMEDDTLSQSDKALCQKMLLTISIKEKLFTNEQRTKAKSLLSRLEGDRRRRCRTSDVAGAGKPKRARARGESNVGLSETSTSINRALLISGSKKKQRPAGAKRGKITSWTTVEDEDNVPGDDDDDDDGDDDATTTSDDQYGADKQRRLKQISLKEAKRRKAWGTGKDQTKAAGRAWPAIPRDRLQTVLSDMIEEVIKIDRAKDGWFSEPVPKDVFPDYYEVISQPMDYSTIQSKLLKGEYRTTVQVQKDFLLVMQNCIKYNSANSDIVKEARTQALAMPGLLREAGFKNNIFIGEDGTVMEIVNDDEKKAKSPKPEDGEDETRKKGSKKSKSKTADEDSADEEDETAKKMENGKKKKSQKKRKNVESVPEEGESEDEGDAHKKKKPRIHIKLHPSKKSSKESDGESDSSDDEDAPISAMAKSSKSKKKKSSKDKLPQTPSKKSGSSKKGSKNSGLAESSKKRKRKTSSKKTDNDDNDSMDDSSAPSKVPVRARSPGPAIPRKKKQRTENVNAGGEEEEEDGEIHEEEEPTKKPETNDEDSEEEGEINEEDGEVKEENGVADTTGSSPAEAHIDKASIKARHEEVVDGTFASARAFFSERGVWKLPPSIESKLDSSKMSKFKAQKEIAKMMLQKMKKLDQYNLFAQPVRDEDAPDYSSTIEHPMDFGTIKTKIDKNTYEKEGSKGILEGMYDDILLTMDNCALYNDEDSEVAAEAARIMSLLPETFANACIAIASSKSKKSSKK